MLAQVEPGFSTLLATRVLNPACDPGSQPCLRTGFRPGFAPRLRHNRIVKCEEMAEKGGTWTERETRLLLQIWREDRIQRQLQGAVRNNAIYQTIANELARHGFQLTHMQCRQKIKALKKRYKSITERMRRRGAG